MNKKTFELFSRLQQREEYSLLIEIEKLNRLLTELNSSFILSSNFLSRSLGERLEELDKKGVIKKESIFGLEDRAINLIRNNEEKIKLISEITDKLHELKEKYVKTQEVINNLLSLVKSNNS
jgi:hypothetical protein